MITPTSGPTVQPPRDSTAVAAVDVSPEAIAALVAAGASALHDPTGGSTTDRPDALPLLVGITHDLRSPLSSMLVLIERLRAGHAGPVTPLQEKQLGLLYAAAFGVASLTNDALDIARGATAELHAAPVAPFAVSQLWQAVRGLVQPIAEEKQLVLRFSGLRADVRMGRSAALHRVLLNLVTNALKFTSSGSVTVSAEALDGDRVRFVVSDTGSGLPPAVRAQMLCAPCENAPLRADGMPSSAGLGIAMCQQLLAAMDSRLEDWSGADRQGTTLGFVLRLPTASRYAF